MLTGRYFLVFWPNEDCYSEVPECKIVGNPGSLGEPIQVKERRKVYSGVLVAVGTKQEVQEKLKTIEVQAKELEPVTSTNNPEPVTATTPTAPIVTVTPAAPTTVATTDAPTRTPAALTTVAMTNAPIMTLVAPTTVPTTDAPATTPATPTTVGTTNASTTTPAAPAESNPKTSKKQGIRTLVVSVDHCVHNVFVRYTDTLHAIVKLELLTSWLSSSPCVLRFAGRKRKAPTEKVATGKKNGSEKPPKKRQKK
jgi:hypothetical protein